MSRFVTANAHIAAQTMHIQQVYGVSFVCKYQGYREE